MSEFELLFRQGCAFQCGAKVTEGEKWYWTYLYEVCFTSVVSLDSDSEDCRDGAGKLNNVRYSVWIDGLTGTRAVQLTCS
jgi:hypothetical protein